jgi:cystathionine beta-lyase/cystathionine gamma-synthase
MHLRAPALPFGNDRSAVDGDTLAMRISRLEGGSSALLCTSWPSALALVTLATVGAGGHVLYHHEIAPDSLQWFQRAAASLGIHAEPVAADEPAKVADGLARGARAVFAQQLPEDAARELDAKALAWHCRAFGAHLCIDNTELTPILAKPLGLGADLVLHRHLVPLCGDPGASISALVVADDQLAEKLARTAEALGVRVRAMVNAPSLLEGLGSLRVRVESARTTTCALVERLHAEMRAEVLSIHHVGHFLRLAFSGRAEADAVRNALPAKLFSAERSVSTTFVAPSQAAPGAGRGRSMRLRTGLEAPDELWATLARALAAASEPLVGADPSEP